MILIIIILICIFYLFNDYLKKNENFSNFNNKVSILLTCTVNINNNITFLYQRNNEERKKLYIDRIKKWLYNTNLNIIVVENSNENFFELKEELEKFKDRFEIFTYDSNEEKDAIYLKNNTSKGAHELYSIQYAYKHSNLLQNSDFIIKITGRYYVEQLENFLKNKNLNNYDALRQNDNFKCEIVGCNRNYFDYIFNPNPVYNDIFGNVKSNNAFVEKVYKERIDRLPKNKILTCPIFDIEPTQQGGYNKIRTFL